MAFIIEEAEVTENSGSLYIRIPKKRAIFEGIKKGDKLKIMASKIKNLPTTKNI